MVIVDPVIEVRANILVIHGSFVVITVVIPGVIWGLTVSVVVIPIVISIVILEPRLNVSVVLLILTQAYCAKSVSL